MNRLLFIVFIISSTLSAQVKISGKVVTLDNSPIEFAEVTLFSEANVPLKNSLTNEKGDFSIEHQAGTYKLEIRQFKEILHSNLITVNSDYDAGSITVNTTNVLENVVITKAKPVVERKIDRLVFNVENTISAAGGDAMDALRVTPGLQVRNDNITMVGRSTVRVLLDDKMLELGQEELANLLKSIPSDNIKSIEVITTPPAKYDAAGNSGLINIKLKRAKKDLTSLSLGTSYLRRTYDGEGAVTSNFMYNKDALSLTASLNYREGGETFKYRDVIHFPDELWNSNQVFQRDYKRGNGIVNIEYVISPKWTSGVQYITNFNHIDGLRAGNTIVNAYDTNAVVKNVLSDTHIDQKPNFHSVNLFNAFKLDTIGKKLTVNLDYFKYSNKDTRPYDGTIAEYNPDSLQYFRGINSNDQQTSNFSGKVDFDLPTKVINWSFGGKVTILRTENILSAFNSGLVTDPVTNMPEITNNSSYDEDIQAAYVSGSKKFTDNFEVQFGLRLEATQTESFNANLAQAITNDYTKLFPTLNMVYTPKENTTLGLNYSRRIVRPNFAELNPNVTYINPFLTVEGNPFLRPFTVDNIEFSFGYKKLESKAYFVRENNAYNQIGFPDSDTYNVRLTNRNLFNINRYGISEIYIFDKFSWWNSYSTFDLNYLTSESTDPSALAVDGYYVNFSTNNDFVLNKNKTVLFNVYFECMPVGTYGVNKLDLSSSTSVSLQYLLLNKDLRITLRGNNIFRTDNMRFNSTVSGVYRDSNYYTDTRLIQLSLNYKFGNKKLNVSRRETGNTDERARTGN
ncbi:hypothetical protein B4N84_02125 [Flavobacterium sp. IR1]|nr:hypothetical protein B4N84_02125 [Flavobacterium sp. IR1]